MSQTPAFLNQLPRAKAAWIFAAEMHGDQRRASDGAPFMEHPREVAALLHDADASDEVVAAGVLHDTIELTRATLADVEERFGTEVEGLVSAVTEDPSIRSYGQRKAALRLQAVDAGHDAAILFAADKLSKVREYRAQLARAAVGGTPPRPRRLNHYAASLVDLERIIPGHPLVVELRKELTPLAALPAVGAAANQGSLQNQSLVHDE